MNKKVIRFLALFVMLFLTCSSVLAADTTGDTTKIESSKTTFEVVDKSICEMDLNNMGHFKKELTNFDVEKRELTITLTVTNTANAEEAAKPVEIFLVLDNSSSMTKNYGDKSKMDYVTEVANSFANSLFNHFTNIKIGIIGFSSTKEFVNGTTGSLADASVLLPLSNSAEAVKNTIDSYGAEHGPWTNIEAGLSLAETNFSSDADTKKYIVLLSDGVPNLSLDTEHTLTYSGVNSANTKKKLQEVSQKYTLYSVLMGYYEKDVQCPTAFIEGGKTMTYGELAEEIFGTPTTPTAGKFYYIDYENLNDTINKDIYNDITYKKDNSLKNIVIKDYIPQKIMDNFDFMHSVAPNIGTVTDKVDTSDNNSITWTIPVLEEGQVATLSYKLKLKDSIDKSILNEVLPTNTKVDIDFETPDGKDKTTSDVSPKVKITYEEPKPEPKPEEPKPDNTVAEKPIPQTGNYTNIFFVLTVIGIIVFATTRMIRLKNLK